MLEELVQPDGRRPPLASEIDTRDKLFNQHVMEWFWPFGREEPHDHPPFYAIVGLLGDVVAPNWELLDRARLGPMCVFSLTAGALFAFMTRRFGIWAGIAAWAAWICQPRLFAHAHYAHYDNILACLWICAILAFAKAVEPGDSASTDEKPRQPCSAWEYGRRPDCLLP